MSTVEADAFVPVCVELDERIRLERSGGLSAQERFRPLAGAIICEVFDRDRRGKTFMRYRRQCTPHSLAALRPPDGAPMVKHGRMHDPVLEHLVALGSESAMTPRTTTE